MTAAAKFRKDVSKLGLRIDEDTVRKWLKEAAQLVALDNLPDGR